MDHQALPPVDCTSSATPEPAVDELLARASTSRGAPASRHAALGIERRQPPRLRAERPDQHRAWSRRRCATRWRHDVCLVHLPLGWDGDIWHFRHPLDFLGSDGGGGIGAGPGLTVGAALALKGSGRLPVAILGDGDYLMGAPRCGRRPLPAFRCSPWSPTTARSSTTRCIRSAWRRCAAGRSRTSWIGQRIDEPAPDLAMMARAQGARRHRSGHNRRCVAGRAGRCGARGCEQGKAVVVDVHVQPGYNPAMAAGITRGHG